MKTSIVLNNRQFANTIRRLCYQLIENHNDFTNSVLVGLQPNGVYLANRLKQELEIITKKSILTGFLDITFYRDDFRRNDTPLIPSVTNLDFSLENKKVVLIDDVLFTGRTVRSGLDAVMDYGRPSKVELLALIERRFTRHIPIRADYIGNSIDSLQSERVKVTWKENGNKDEVLLYTPKEK
jgi:pyrimidine operon attenuation protein/uracil phosphoribosyltransferase